MTATRILQFSHHHDLMRGNWWPFPPPAFGVYNVRKPSVNLDGKRSYTLYPTVPVTQRNTSGGMECLGMNAATEMKLAGYEFQFPSTGRFVARIGSGSPFVPLKQHQSFLSLPTAHSIEEARYIVTQIPDRWPALRTVHVEYVEHQT